MREISTPGLAKRNRLVAFWRHRLVQSFLSDKLTVVAALFIAVVALAAVAAPWIPYDPYDQHLRYTLLPPLSSTPEGFFALGTDSVGRDTLIRLIYGGRVSLAVAFASVLASSAIGVTLGLVSGFYKGFLDDLIMRAVDVMMSVPSLLMALFILYVFGPGFRNIILVFAVTRWMLYCRISRGVVLSLREVPYVEAARAIGCTDARILLRHILPNLMTSLLTVATIEVAHVILSEATLSFLGLGIQPPDSTWGLMLAQARTYMLVTPWVVAIPGLAIFLTVLSFNLVGVWMRAVSDPTQRWRWLRVAKPEGV